MDEILTLYADTLPLYCLTLDPFFPFVRFLVYLYRDVKSATPSFFFFLPPLYLSVFGGLDYVCPFFFLFFSLSFYHCPQFCIHDPYDADAQFFFSFFPLPHLEFSHPIAF